MGSRRKASAKANVTPAGVPKELLDMDSSHWKSRASTVRWLDAHNVVVPSGLDEADKWIAPLNLRRVITAWAVAAGHASEQFPQSPDTRFMVASGLSASYSKSLRQGMMTLATPEGE